MDLKVLSMEVGDDDPAEYRMLFQDRVRYVEIELGIWEREIMSIPPELLPQLPRFPSGDWNTLHILRGDSGEVELHTSTRELPAVTECLFAPLVDVLSLEEIDYMRFRLREVRAPGIGVCVSKIARFEHEIPYTQAETCAYAAIAKSTAKDLIPRVLGHLHEHGRVMGLLLEKLDGRPANIKDLDGCRQALRRIHEEARITHGDINRFNFVVVQDQTGREVVKAIDLETAGPWTEEGAQKDLDSLEAALKDTSSLGSSEVVD